MQAAFGDDLSHWPAEQSVFFVPDLDLRVLDGQHPWERQNATAIAENWHREVAANPALFDGRLVLQHRLGLGPRGLAGEAYVAGFSTFLWWRKQEDRRGALHLFAYPVIESSDGALVAIRMGRTTANPGHVYFAAGSVEDIDIVDGRCDIAGNMRREVLEETGLDLATAQADEGFQASHYRRAVTLFRRYRFDLTAEEIAARIERHMETADDDEIDGPVIIRSADPQAHPYNVAMLPVIDWYFNGRGG